MCVIKCAVYKKYKKKDTVLLLKIEIVRFNIN